MAEVVQHYGNHLGPVYSWLVGGLDSALARGESELESLGIQPSNGGIAVDLGAGFGMHSIPLARRGYSVLAVDNCGILMEELESQRASLPIRSVLADLCDFDRHLAGKANWILFMGDTICHLPDLNAIQGLVNRIATSLEVGGTFVTSFRDYTSELREDARFIPVRSEDSRILTCFLEYGETHVKVHDLLHERTATGWKLAVSGYCKVRLSPAWLMGILEQAGFSVVRQTGLSGMVRIVATLAQR